MKIGALTLLSVRLGASSGNYNDLGSWRYWVRTAHILSESITVQSYTGVCKHSESGLSIHVLWLLGSMWVSSQIRGLNQALGLVGSTS